MRKKTFDMKAYRKAYREQNKDKFKEYRDRYKEKNPEQVKKSRQKSNRKYCIARNEYAKERRQSRKREVLEYLGGKCCVCNEKRIPCLDIHHKDKEKKTSHIAFLLTCSEERLYAELENCILLCSNCHRIWHAGEKDFEYEF